MIAIECGVTAYTRPDLRKYVANRILAYLEGGTVPRRQAWTSTSGRPINAKNPVGQCSPSTAIARQRRLQRAALSNLASQIKAAL